MATRVKIDTTAIRISAAGVDVETATGDDVLWDSRYPSIGVYAAGNVTLSAADITSSFNNGWGLTRIYTRVIPFARTFRDEPFHMCVVKDKTQARSGAYGATPNLFQDYSTYFYSSADGYWHMTGFKATGRVVASTTALTITLTVENYESSAFSIANYEFAYKVFFS